MTFLNPFVLFGLAAAAIPVILHLLNLRKLRTIEFSTLTFLKELQQTKIRRLKLRQLLLLIIRTLLIIAVVLAFARPALRGTVFGTIGTHAHSTVVFIFDDSFSMTASDEHGELLKQAKESAGKLIDVLKDGDEAFLVKLSDLPLATIEPATHDFKQLRTIINEARISPVRRPLEDALRVSARLLSQSKNANKEIYIISDNQRTQFPENLTVTEQASASLFDDRVKFFQIRLGEKEPANVGIDSVEVKTTILEKNKPAIIYASVRNFSNVPIHDYVASVFLDGIRAAQKNINADEWGSASLEFSVVPKKSGFIKGYIELESDGIEQDNRRYFTLFIPEQLNVVLVSNNSTDTRFTSLALQSGNSDSGISLLNIRQQSIQQFPLIDLQNTDVLMFSNIRSFSQNDADRIRRFSEQGGGIILLPGSDMLIENYNTTLLRELHIPPIEGITGTISQPAGLSFQKIDYDHPLFATVFENARQRKRNEPQVIESANISVSLKRQSGKQARTIIALSDGTPFLSEHTLGLGTILFYSVGPLTTWSDFPLKGVFVPLMYRSVIYASSKHEVQPSYTVGEEQTISIRNAGQRVTGKPVKAVYPDATEEIIQPTVQSSSLMFPLRHLSLPGYYELKSDNSILSTFSANVDSRESDLRKISSDDLPKFWQRLGIQPSSVQTFEPGSNLETSVLESRFGVELWKYCIGLALLLALIEMFIARDSRKAHQQSIQGVTAI